MLTYTITETGMQALTARGLNLAALDKSDQVEVLTWLGFTCSRSEERQRWQRK